MVGDGTPGRYGGISRETCPRGDVGRSQSLHSTDAAMAVEGVESKPAPREGRQEGGCVKSSKRQCISYVSPVPATAKQGTETGSWVEASIWTERMLAALENGVKGGNLDVDLIIYDTITASFTTDYEDDPDDTDVSLRQFGHAKEGTWEHGRSWWRWQLPMKAPPGAQLGAAGQYHRRGAFQKNRSVKARTSEQTP